MRYKNTDALPVKGQAKAEYIKREDAIKALTGWDTDPTDEEIGFALNKIPAADVVEVVRCKDCKFYDVLGLKCLHPRHIIVMGIDDFCSHGERSNENAE